MDPDLASHEEVKDFLKAVVIGPELPFEVTGRRYDPQRKEIVREPDPEEKQEILSWILGTSEVAGRAELRAGQAQEGNPPFIRRGEKSRETFKSRREDIERNVVTEDQRRKILERLEDIAGLEQAPAIRKKWFKERLTKLSGGELKIYALDPISVSIDDYLFGYYDETENKLFVSRHFLAQLEARAPPADSAYDRQLLREVIYPAKKVAVLGASGSVGGETFKVLKDVYPEVIGTAYSNVHSGFELLDVTQEQSIEEFIDRHHPDVIVYAAGEADPDRAEADPARAAALNTIAPKLITRHFDGQFIYLSTAYVFDGSTPPYGPHDAQNPLNFYGETKAEGETHVLAKPNNTVVRLGIIYGLAVTPVRNFVKKIVQKLDFHKEGDEPLALDNEQVRHPVWTRDIAELVLMAISGKKTGVLQINGTESLTSYEWARMIADVYYSFYPYRPLSNFDSEFEKRFRPARAVP